MTGEGRDDLCAVILAAGLGKRLRPLTEVLPKPLCPIDNVPLLDLAIASVRGLVDDIAVNVHYRADDVRRHLAGTGVHISDETDRLLGSAGALGHLAGWIDGRSVLVRNSDMYLHGSLDDLVRDWDGERPRILGVEVHAPADFGTVRYVGASLIPARSALRLPDDIAALSELVWQPAWLRGELEIVEATFPCIDCGTPRDYLRANLLASGGASVIGPRAVVEGELERVVVWPDARVGPDEQLRDCIRIGADLTIDAR